MSLAGEKGIEYDSKHDLVLEGVNVVSTGNVKLKGNNVEINPLETENWEEVKKSKKGFAFSSGSGSISLSYGKDKNSRKNTNVVQNTSEITSAKNLEINADNNIDGKSVNLYGKDNVILNAKNDINLETANNSEEIKTKARSDLKKTYDNVKNIKKLVDPSKDTYGMINTASNLVGAIKDGASAVNTIMNEKYNPKANSAASSNLSPVSKDVKDYVTASIGLSSSKSSSKSYQEQVEKNKIASEGNIEIESDNSSVSIAGADIKAGKNVLISAKNKVELKAGEEKNEYSSSASSRGISVDVINKSVDLSASGQKGKGNGINYVNSKVEAGEDYTVTSKEIEHIGANVKANRINITGDKVVIASKQDISKSKNSSYGGNIGIGAKGVKSLSLNASKGKGNGSWVNEQTSLEAKNGGLIKAGKVENTGAIISSESEENKLKVVADEIVVKDLKDKYKYENKGGGISISSDVPNVSLVHDKVEREQTTKATATNTEFVINGEEKEAKDLGFNTNKDEAQEVTKDKEKHLNAELHTDLLGKDKRDELAKAGKKLKVVGETLVSNKSGNKLDNLKEGVFGVIVDDYRKKHEEEFKLVKEVTNFLIEHGYKGKIPEIMLTDSEHSYTQDGKNKETGEKQTEKIFFSIHDLENPEIGFAKLMTHEMTHLNTYDEGKGGEESSIYAREKVGESKKEFSAKEKEEYLKEVSEKYPMTKTLKEQYQEAKNIPESEREHFYDKETHEKYKNPNLSKEEIKKYAKKFNVSEKEIEKNEKEFFYNYILKTKNRKFKTYKEFLENQNKEETPYKKVSKLASLYHNVKYDPSMNEPEIDLNFPNIKYVNENGEEAVFNKVTGKWVEDGINDATYNIAGLDGSLKGIIDNFSHLLGENSDVNLWVEYGVGFNDKLTKKQRQKIQKIGKAYYTDFMFRNYVNGRGKLNYSVYKDYLKMVGEE